MNNLFRSFYNKRRQIPAKNNYTKTPPKKKKKKKRSLYYLGFRVLGFKVCDIQLKDKQSRCAQQSQGRTSLVNNVVG
jgi:hypothetical protein